MNKITKYGVILDDGMQLVRECHLGDSPKLNRPDLIRDFLCSGLVNADKQINEHSYMLCFNTKQYLTGYFEVTAGTVNSSIITPRDMYIRALLANAVYIVMAHNHPSGDPEPSVEDCEITRKIKEAGDLIGIPLIDHIIVGNDGRFYSFKGDDRI